MNGGNTFQNIFEACIYYGSFRWKYSIQCIHFLICIIHIFHFIYEPCIAVSIRVFDRHCLSLSGRKDEILRIQHVQDAEFGSIHAVHFSACGGNNPIDGLRFRRNVPFDHLLITTQLGSMISAHTLVPVGSIILVECISGEIQYTVVRISVLQDDFVSFRFFESINLGRTWNELIIVQIALVDSPHIDHAKNGNACNNIGSL